MAARETFTSRFSTILTMVGFAVGLGNVWRLPYKLLTNTADNGFDRPQCGKKRN